MKNVITNSKKVILMVAMMVTVIGYANDISIKFGKDLKETALTINNVKEGNLLSIKDSYGVTLYNETIEQSGVYIKGFDLTYLPDGSYFFELDKEMEIKTIPFTVKSNEVTYNKENETVVFKPFVRKKDGLLYVSKLATQLEPLKINIFDLYGNKSKIIYSETIEGVQNIERVYKLRKGKYKIILNTNSQEFTKYINK